MNNYVPLRKAVEATGLHPNTLRKYADSGKIEHYRTPNGDRMYEVSRFVGAKASTVVYCRVSTTKQKADLDRQIDFCLRQEPGAEVVKDIASGLNFKRKGLRALLERAMRGERLKVVVSYKDRLARFGFELIEWLIERNGGEIVVLNHMDTSPETELVHDLSAVITVFSARLHGLRNYRSKIKSDLTKADKEPTP